MVKERIAKIIYNGDRTLAQVLLNCGPQETISSQVGRAAEHGKRSGKILRAVLDSHAAGWMTGGALGPGHCEAAVKHADELAAADDGKEK